MKSSSLSDDHCGISQKIYCMWIEYLSALTRLYSSVIIPCSASLLLRRSYPGPLRSPPKSNCVIERSQFSSQLRKSLNHHTTISVPLAHHGFVASTRPDGCARHDSSYGPRGCLGITGFCFNDLLDLLIGMTLITVRTPLNNRPPPKNTRIRKRGQIKYLFGFYR